jgi:hypothetical protein
MDCERELVTSYQRLSTYMKAVEKWCLYPAFLPDVINLLGMDQANF